MAEQQLRAAIAEIEALKSRADAAEEALTRHQAQMEDMAQRSSAFEARSENRALQNELAYTNQSIRIDKIEAQPQMNGAEATAST